ncbi:MAG: hypothetical protein Q9162_007920 [Coniocarpon cinnabarinum]
MQLLNAVLAASLALSAWAAKSKPASDAFDRFHTKSLSSYRSVSLDESSFGKLTASPRNHTAAVLLTALETRFGCSMCRTFQPEYELLTKSWLKGDREGKSRVVYGTLDFTDGRSVFQSMNLQTAPVLLLYPPTVGLDAKPDGTPYRYDFSQGAQSAEGLHAWITRHLPASAEPRPEVHRPFNWLRFVGTTTTILGVVTATYSLWSYISPILYNRNLWAGLSIIAILLFTSGHMFNHIRGAPYIASDGKGGIQYFAPGFQSQFGLESQLVAAMCTLMFPLNSL